jgi:uncharacterized membrane protein YqaE (UPF0057 family)
MDSLRIVTAVLLPPFAIFRERGFGGSFWLNLLLTALGVFPGIFHALWVMADIEDGAPDPGMRRNLWPAGS